MIRITLKPECVCVAKCSKAESSKPEAPAGNKSQPLKAQSADPKPPQPPSVDSDKAVPSAGTTKAKPQKVGAAPRKVGHKVPPKKLSLHAALKQVMPEQTCLVPTLIMTLASKRLLPRRRRKETCRMRFLNACNFCKIACHRL